MGKAGGYLEFEFVAELYDHIVPYQHRPDIEFYVDAAREAGGTVLEVACGTGRVLIPTARAGVDIVGLDLSPHMLAICRDRLKKEPAEVQARVHLIEADMRDFDLKQEFSLVTTPFRPFQHLTTVEDQITCLKSIHRHLKPGGRFILDIFNPSLEALTRDNLGEEIGDEPAFSTPDGRRVLRRHKVVARDFLNQVNHSELIYHVTYPDGRQETLIHAFQMRYLYRFEAEHLLARCGFRVVHLYSDFMKSPLGTKDRGELLFVAQKVP